MSYTLVYSCKPMRAAYEPNATTKLFNAILKEKFTRLKSTRIVIKNNKYIYHPTGEYQSYVTRFRGIK